MDPILERIAGNVIRNSASKEEIRMETLWEEKPCVIVFFRRFGCVFCRQCAKEICMISSTLSAHGVRLIGVGFDEYGADEFMKEGYFDGELYLDPPQTNYKALRFRRYGIAALCLSLLNKQIQQSYAKVTAEGMKGNLLSGDSFQNGGALVVSSKSDGPKVLLSFRQENPIDYVPNEDVLRVLEISVTEA